MKVTAIGIDLAKSVLQVHGVDEHGKMVIRKQLRRGQVPLPPGVRQPVKTLFAVR